MAQDSASVVPFNFEDFEIRIVMIDGEPWWVASDVCGALGISDARRAVDRLDSADRRKTPVSSGGQNRESWLVNESGLYELIIRSNKPDARRFRRWITGEVLPSIRRTGRYETGRAEKSKLEIARDLVAALEAVERAETALSVAGPKAETWDAVVADAEWFSSGEVAKMLCIAETGRTGLLSLLRLAGVLYDERCTSGRHPVRHCGGSHVEPYSEHVKAGRMAIKMRPGTGSAKRYQYPGLFFSPSGLDYVRRKLSR